MHDRLVSRRIIALHQCFLVIVLMTSRAVVRPAGTCRLNNVASMSLMRRFLNVACPLGAVYNERLVTL